MKFTLHERIVTPGILPKEGNYIQNVIVSDLMKKLTLTQDEIEKYGVVPVGNFGGVAWNEEGSKAEFNLELTKREEKVIEDALKLADTGEKLPISLIGLYKQVCLKDETTP